MGNIRTVKTENYSILSNGFINDPSLSFQEVGLLAYLLSKPNDWRVNITHLSSCHTNGKDAVYSLIASLGEKGYVVREQGHGDGGKFASVEYTVHEEPVGKTASGKTVSGRAVSGESTTTNTELEKGLKEQRTEHQEKRSDSPRTRSPQTSTEAQVNQSASRPSPSPQQSVLSPPAVAPPPSDLARFVHAYPEHRRHADRQDIIALWRGSEARRPPIDALLFKLAEQTASHQWTKDFGQYVPGIMKYLRDEGWKAPIMPPPEPRYKSAADWNSAKSGELVL